MSRVQPETSSASFSILKVSAVSNRVRSTGSRPGRAGPFGGTDTNASGPAVANGTCATTVALKGLGRSRIEKRASDLRPTPTFTPAVLRKSYEKCERCGLNQYRSTMLFVHGHLNNEWLILASRLAGGAAVGQPSGSTGQEQGAAVGRPSLSTAFALAHFSNQTHSTASHILQRATGSQQVTTVTMQKKVWLDQSNSNKAA